MEGLAAVLNDLGSGKTTHTKVLVDPERRDEDDVGAEQLVRNSARERRLLGRRHPREPLRRGPLTCYLERTTGFEPATLTLAR